MGPFNIDRQYQRIEAIERLLCQDNLSPQTRDMWRRIQNGIALTESEYNQRVCWVYRNHRRGVIEYE